MNTVAVALAIADGVWQTTDAGFSWHSLSFPQDGYDSYAIDISMPDDNHVWVATDAGRILAWQAKTGRWQEQFRDSNVTKFMNYIKMFDDLNGIAMGDALGDGLPAVFLNTTDGGAHWLSAANNGLAGSWSGDIWRRMDFVSPDIGYFYESGVAPQRIFKTLDGAANWTAVPLPDTVFVQRLKFCSDRIGIVKGLWWENPSVNGQVIARTLDGGGSWEVFNDTTMRWGNDFEFVPGDPAKVWFTDNSKLYFSADTGRTWLQRWSRGGRDIVFPDPLHGWVLGDDTLLLYTSTGGVTAVEAIEPTSAMSFSLGQNYPNPFNPTTTIRYALPHRSHVTLTIYNTLGQQAATLVNGEVEAGFHEVKFNACNLASGVYFYRIQAAVFTETKRMVILR